MSGKEILLVEDNDNDVLLTKRALVKAGIKQKLTIARDGLEAVEYLFGTPEKPHPKGTPCPALILLDLKIPKIIGLEVLKRIRANERTCMCPVVILTSSDEEFDIIGGYKLGANSYIRKPVDFNKFVDTVRKMGLYWLDLNEPPPENRNC
jgi:two-component system, response regulator